jgi:hypothetical protein
MWGRLNAWVDSKRNAFNRLIEIVGRRIRVIRSERNPTIILILRDNMGDDASYIQNIVLIIAEGPTSQ